MHHVSNEMCLLHVPRGSPHIVIGYPVDRRNIIKEVTIMEKKTSDERMR
jgi:hypothetical protein